MNKTVELVMEWGQFEQNHKDGTLEEFCRHYLIQKRDESEIQQNFNGIVPPDLNTYLAKLIGRIYQIVELYSKIAIRSIPDLYNLDDFYFLNTIKHLELPKKTDIIHHNFAQLSSGIDVLNRLRKKGLIEEYADPGDKRAKLLRTTQQGEDVLTKCYAELYKVNDAIFFNMPQADKRLCIQLLKGLELKHAKIVTELKTGGMIEIHERLTGVKVKPAD